MSHTISEGPSKLLEFLLQRTTYRILNTHMNIWGCTELDINIGPIGATPMEYCMDVPQETKNSTII